MAARGLCSVYVAVLAVQGRLRFGRLLLARDLRTKRLARRSVQCVCGWIELLVIERLAVLVHDVHLVAVGMGAALLLLMQLLLL